MPDRSPLYLHIGLQKTGTSYLQAALLRSRESLAEQGLDLVPPTKRECFELMLVVRKREAAHRDPVSDQATFDRFTAQLDRASGSRAVCSQESLAAAGPAQIERLLAACGDREVHVVLTVRDLARQLPSAWQQAVKAGSTVPYAGFLRRLQSMERAGKSKHPWIHLDPAAVLSRWSDTLPAANVHVVTVPPVGSPATLLLERFSRVLDLDPARLLPEDRPANTSLGFAQAELLRRVNAELPEEVHRRTVYGNVVKRSFAARVLAAQQSRTILVPLSMREWCDEVTARQVEALAAAGYQVEGTLADLQCADSAFSDEVGDPTEREVAAASVAALAKMLAARGAAAASRATGGRVGGGPDGLLRRIRRRVRPSAAPRG